MFTLIKNNKLFTKLTGINLISKVGDKLFYTAMLTTASSLPQANLAVMIVTVSETLPILFSFLLGNISDQMQQKTKNIMSNALLRATIYFIIGLLFHYNHTLKLLIIMASLNFLSDLLGNYSSALVAPFSKILVPQEEMGEAQSLVSLSSQLVNVLANFAGSFLLAIFLVSTVAYINSFIFFLVAIGYALIRKKLVIEEQRIPVQLTKENIFRTTVKTFSSIFKNKTVFNELTQLALINGFFGGITPIFVMYLNIHPQQIISSNAITISLFSGLITIFMIIGNTLSPTYLKKISNKRLAIFANIFIVLTVLGLLGANLLSILFCVSCISFFIGIISPRFTANIINQYPAEKLGGIVTTVNSLLVVVPPITGLIFPALALINIQIAYTCFLIYGLLLIVVGKLI